MVNSDLYGNILDCKNPVISKNDFLEIIKHNLKTPVLAQIRILELLLSGHFGKLKFEQSDILNSTLDSCKYMYKIISDLISSYESDNHFESILFAQKFDTSHSKTCLFIIKENLGNNII